MITHYAHMLAGTGVHPEYSNIYTTLLPWIAVATIEDITGTPSAEYVGLAPDSIVVKVQGSVATLDAIAASPDNVELFRDELPTELV